ncbi:NAD(+)--arginine ADP-ribosyltransferase [Mycolicibacterium mucogenicum]|uniref:WXG100 family type VII secretion target n=1 Tax=Mycolicibacterium mucogenicum TaxID=56689 RepID=UPI002269C456|nr:NAD(+)--arginine ADP-ribosyltransferase [Mycolicibacterium mucogenicum]MCX8564003.1 NAD(+)--arginine ADP-ribosyltransferase [Mycolicibacterium mucogenicum]
MAPIVVDPRALDGAGQSVDAQAEALGRAIDALHSALSGSGGMSGDDPAGIVHGRAYDKSAKAMLEAMVDLRNGMARIGDGIRASATSYSRAEVASNTHGTSGAPLPAAAPTAFVSAQVPPSAEGSNEGAPPGWSLVEPFLGMIWPDGSPSKLRAAAGAWTAAGSAFLGAEAPLLNALGVVTAQQIPEGGQVAQAVVAGNTNATALFGQCVQVASNLNSYAGHIDATHAAVLDLLSRIVNPMTGIREVWDLLTGEDEDEIKKIADDIRVVINNFKAEVDALATLLAPLIAAAEAIASVMANWAKMELQQFGDAAYNVLADVVNSAASFGNAALHNPLDTLGMIGGAALMAGGAGLEVPGIILDATVVGAAVGVPVNLAGAGMIAAGGTMAGAGAIDLSHEAALNPVIVMHAHTGRPGEGIDRGDGRDRYGHITGRPGGRYAGQREAEGLKQYEKRNPGRWVTNEQRKATVDGGPQGGRFYDGLARQPDGTYEGIEVKSGTAGRDARQLEFDTKVSPENPAYVTITNEQGVVETVKVTHVEVIKVPGE